MYYTSAKQQKNSRFTSSKAVSIKQASSVKNIIQPKLKIGAANDKYEQEADRVADQVMRMPKPTQFSPLNSSQTSNISNIQQRPLNINNSPSSKVQRQSLTLQVLDGSVASISWIDPSSPAGGFVSDSDPGATVTENFITSRTGYRFSNFLKARISTTDGQTISSYSLDSLSGLYKGTTHGISTFGFPIRNSSHAITHNGISGIQFDQVVGARTRAAGVAGRTVGASIGVAGGAFAGAKLGGAGGSLFGPLGTLGGAVLGGIVGGAAGFFAGLGVANTITNFPPIWTKLRLKLFADGTKDKQIINHSIFPSSHYYQDLNRFHIYSALAPEQTVWESTGWGSGNPWRANRPRFTP